MAKINWDLYDPLFGSLSDTAIAEIAGCHRSTVGRRRMVLGEAAQDRLCVADVARLLDVSPQRSSVLFRGRKFAVFQGPCGRRYTTRAELDLYIAKRGPP